MKALKALIGGLVVLAVVSLGGCLPAKYAAKPNEELYGTWQNEAMREKKVAIEPDSFKAYSLIADSDAFYTGTLEIAAKWKDANGNLCYKTYKTVTEGAGGFKGSKVQVLYKVSSSGAVLEGIDTPVKAFDPNAFPTRLDPSSSSYGKYYRMTEHSPRRVLIGDEWSEPSQEKPRN